MVPDYISEKKMLEFKVDKNGEGHCYTCMGCRSFLTPFINEEGKPQYYGRFNQGVVTVNLIDIALSGPQGRVLRMPLAMPDMLDTFESFRFGDLKVTNFEMEGSAIAGIAAHLGHNAGTVCCIIAHRHHKASNPDYKPQVRKLIELCLDKLAE